MPIVRTDNPDGSWTEKATDAKSAKELFEKHGKDIQKHGEKKFHETFLKQQAVGFERLRDPSGAATYVPADEVDRSFASGYSPMNQPRTTVPDLPWHKDRKPNYGRHKYKYNRETGQMEEVS